MQRQARQVVRYRRSFQELLFSPWILVPLAVIVGAFISEQFFHLSWRYVKLLFGLAFLLAIIRLPLPVSLCIFVVIFPAPTSIFLGDTNVIFIGVLFVAWIGQVGLGRLPKPTRIPVGWAIFIYLGAHLLSCLNIGTTKALTGSIEVMTYTVAGVLLYFLLVNSIRSERWLDMFLKALCLTSLFVDITAIYEYVTGGERLIPAWFHYTRNQGWEAGRLGGVFGFHGLLADFCAIMFYLQVMLGMRSRRLRAKIYYYGLAILDIPLIFLTVNRGGAIIWALGGLAFLWFTRHRIRWRRVLPAASVLIVVLSVLRISSGSGLVNLGLLSRLSQTTFVGGIPDDRVKVWAYMAGRIPEHFWIGHGPFYDLAGGGSMGTFWPHSAYLFYLYTVGIVGLSVWLWILGKLIWTSYPGSDVDLAHWPLPRAALAVSHIQLIMFAMSQLRDEHQRGNVYLYVMWILFALAGISRQLITQERRQQWEASRRSTAGDSAGTVEVPAPFRPPSSGVVAHSRIGRGRR